MQDQPATEQKKSPVLSPPRFQDQMMVVCTHTVTGERAFAVQSTRVHLVDALGNPLPQPMPEPLDEPTAFEEIMEACQQFFHQILKQREAAKARLQAQILH